MTNNYTYRGRHRATTAQTVTTRTRRSIALAGASAAALAGLGAGPAAADPVDDLRAGITDGALNAHDSALAALDTLDALDTVPEIPQEVRDVYGQGVTDLTDAVAPGALAQREADRAAARAAADAATAEQSRRDAWNNTSSTPCPVTADACVDLDGRRAWLQDGGNTVYGPVYISSGAPGADTETPRGTFHVTYKVRDEVSREFNNAPMPYSVYFTNSGHAFHEGDPDVESAGCIHLSGPDAVAFFDALEPGDEVFIY
ncbi:MAG: L,D-transpeptidase [Corynebacterium provencense]|uniref:L,D-transpeptidase n=1 Tax=Corynebacterium provencense TaxID=1737425 RepID=UPI002989BFBF|nr:L,D-transpeptidase [Corynebacterium provencense]